MAGWLFLLFFAANYQPLRARFPQSSCIADGSADKKTAKPPL
jgi:hypothetical protein